MALCPVAMLWMWRSISPHTETDLLFKAARSDMPLLRSEFTARLRTRLTAAARHIPGLEAFDPTRWCGISFRKSCARQLYGRASKHVIMDHMDHEAWESTRAYGRQDAESRGAHVALIAQGFASGF